MRTKIKITIPCLILFLSLLISCKKEEVPTVTTLEVTGITHNSALCGGTITNEGTGTVTERGICWSTNIDPTINDNKLEIGQGAGSFTSTLSQLNGGTIYYIRAYAINSAGTGYGMTMSFTTQLADIDGNIYQIVKIGNQTWMKENLKVKKYNNGDPILTTSPHNLDISSEVSPKYYWAYAGNENYVPTYGRLYTWYAATDNRKICPTGWHVPTDDEWTTLATYLGGMTVAGGKLKELGTSHWSAPNTSATNESGFTALPSGDRLYNGAYFDLYNYGNWWSSTLSSTNIGWYIYLGFNSGEMTRSKYSAQDGFSIRCIKN